jgi:hypothetical protein
LIGDGGSGSTMLYAGMSAQLFLWTENAMPLCYFVVGDLIFLEVDTVKIEAIEFNVDSII